MHKTLRMLGIKDDDDDDDNNNDVKFMERARTEDASPDPSLSLSASRIIFLSVSSIKVRSLRCAGITPKIDVANKHRKTPSKCQMLCCVRVEAKKMPPK